MCHDENPIDVQDVHDTYLDEYLGGWRLTLGPEQVDAKLIELDTGQFRISVDTTKQIDIDLEPETDTNHAALIAAIRERNKR